MTPREIGVLNEPGWTVLPPWRCPHVLTTGGPDNLRQCVNRNQGPGTDCGGPHRYDPPFAPVRTDA